MELKKTMKKRKIIKQSCGQIEDTPREQIHWYALILFLVMFTFPASLPISQSGTRANDGSVLEVIGVLKDQAGKPAEGEIVYIAAINNGRISTSFKLEQGRTTGLINPHSQTDAKGRFSILVEPDFFDDQGSEFTIGILDCARCFTNPRRRLIQGGLPLTFRLGSKKTGQLDLGEIRLE